MMADTLFPYLKASVEKTIALVGATHGITNLDSKKEHRKRVAALKAGLPPGVETQPYAQFLFAMVGAEHLEDLNSYRSGLLHKRGIADLQPHAYHAKAAMDLPLRRIFTVVHEQHVKNTALLLVALALLTDELARLDPPPFPITVVDELWAATQPERDHLREQILTHRIEALDAEETQGATGELFAGRARLRRTLNRPVEAMADLREALGRGVDEEAMLHFELGVNAMDTDLSDKDIIAVEAFSSAIALNPEMAEAYYGRALAKENLGDLAGALPDLTVAIEWVARPAELLEKRGYWHLALGRAAEAGTDLEAAVGAGLTSARTLSRLGTAYLHLGKLQEAETVLAAAVASHPNDVEVRMARATLRLFQGDNPGACQDLDHVIASPDHPKTPGALAIRATLRDEGGDRAGALADLTHACTRLGNEVPEEWIELLHRWESREDGEPKQ